MYLVAQIGARRHYAVPEILYSGGLLHRFCADAVAVGPLPEWLCGLPSLIGRIASRRPAVPVRLVDQCPGLALRYHMDLRRARSEDERLRAYLNMGRAFAVRTRAKFKGSAVWAFNSAALELLSSARSSGMSGVVEQTILPYEIQSNIMAKERACWPDWQGGGVPGEEVSRRYIQRERSEWHEATHIICGSERVRQAIGEAGGPIRKCHMVPSGVVLPMLGGDALPLTRRGGPLRVLIVGAVGLRKGSQYALGAAQELGSTVCIRMVGPINAGKKVFDRLRRHVELVGSVPRAQVREHYDWADVFLLPSLCEGAALSVFEAQAYGLPVVCTHECGSQVQHGETGLLISARSSESIVEALGRIDRDRELLSHMRNAARRKRSLVGMTGYADRLLSVARFALRGNRRG